MVTADEDEIHASIGRAVVWETDMWGTVRTYKDRESTLPRWHPDAPPMELVRTVTIFGRVAKRIRRWRAS